MHNDHLFLTVLKPCYAVTIIYHILISIYFDDTVNFCDEPKAGKESHSTWIGKNNSDIYIYTMQTNVAKEEFFSAN